VNNGIIRVTVTATNFQIFKEQLADRILITCSSVAIVACIEEFPSLFLSIISAFFNRYDNRSFLTFY
jgi:hypothetical protein